MFDKIQQMNLIKTSNMLFTCLTLVHKKCIILNIRGGNKDYKNRITDDLLKLKLDVFGAALIVGPKGVVKLQQQNR